MSSKRSTFRPALQMLEDRRCMAAAVGELVELNEVENELPPWQYEVFVTYAEEPIQGDDGTDDTDRADTFFFNPDDVEADESAGATVDTDETITIHQNRTETTSSDSGTDDSTTDTLFSELGRDHGRRTTFWAYTYTSYNQSS